MTHPLEQLTDAVDGALSPAEQATVAEHLRSCASCSEQIELARAARAELQAMPVADAPDLAARFTPDRVAALTSGGAGDVAGPARRPVSAPPGPAGRPVWSKIVTALAAAAVVALVALAIPRLGDSTEGGTAASGPAATSELADEGTVRLQAEQTDYDTAALGKLAASFTDELARTTANAAAPAEGGPELAPGSASRDLRFAPGRTRVAVACLKKAFPGYPGQIVQVRLASFEGTAAYLAVVLESVRPAGPADSVSIWVAAVEDCSILSLTSARL